MLSKQWKALNSDFADNREAFNLFPLKRKSGQNIGSEYLLVSAQFFPCGNGKPPTNIYILENKIISPYRGLNLH